MFEVMRVEDILKQSLLYDFYGELLTEHRKEIYEQFIAEDLSLSEIAQTAGISRQGVYDLVKRCDRTLEEYEAKLHLVEKFLNVKQKVHEMDALLEAVQAKEEADKIQKIRKIAGEIIEEL